MAHTILEQILAHKRVELQQRQAQVSQVALELEAAHAPAPRDFSAGLRRVDRVTLIAEVKRASPSRGVLVEHFDHLALAQTYASNGAAAISVLTDERFFQGSLRYLSEIRAALPAGPPLLRKDFILDPYQVYEARAAGADALLLIVATLDDERLGDLLHLSLDLGMQALVEVHSIAELMRALSAGAQLIGVNNRDLHSFVTDLATTEQVAAQLPAGPKRPLLISESGIFSAADVARLRAVGTDAVLVGEALVTAPDIAAQVRELATFSTATHKP